MLAFEVCFISILIVVAIGMLQMPQMPEFLSWVPEHGRR